jgi:dUTP pyrophosphatase
MCNTGLTPAFMSENAAAFDIRTPYAFEILAHGAMTIDLLIGFEVPKKYCLLLYPRSSLFTQKGLLAPTSIIDWDYRGSIHGQLYNMTEDNVYVNKGERLFQCYITRYYTPNLLRVAELTETDRNTNGLGSTGK